MAGWDAIPRIGDFYKAVDGIPGDWLERPVLVQAGEAIKNAESVPVARTLPALVRLMSTHDCDICAPNTRKFWPSAPNGGIEVVSREGDWEIDASSLRLGERRGRRSTSLDQLPCDVIKTTSIVVDDVSQSQTPARRERRMYLGEGHAKAVVLRLIVSLHGPEPLAFEVASESFDVVVEGIRFDYRPGPLEPRALKGDIHAR